MTNTKGGAEHADEQRRSEDADVVRCRRIELVDEAGRARAILSVEIADPGLPEDLSLPIPSVPDAEGAAASLTDDSRTAALGDSAGPDLGTARVAGAGQAIPEGSTGGATRGRPEYARAEALSDRLVTIWDDVRAAVDDYQDLWNMPDYDQALDELLDPCGGLLVTIGELIRDNLVPGTRPVSPWGLEKMRIGTPDPERR